MKLFEINQQINELIENSVDKETGEIIQANFDEMFSKLTVDKNTKLLDIACVISMLKKEIEVGKEIVDGIRKKISVIENKSDFLRNIIKDNLEVGEKIKDLRVSLYWMNRESVEVNVPPENLPVEFQKITVDAKKTEILKAINSGVNVEGCNVIVNSSLVVR